MLSKHAVAKVLQNNASKHLSAIENISNCAFWEKICEFENVHS